MLLQVSRLDFVVCFGGGVELYKEKNLTGYLNTLSDLHVVLWKNPVSERSLIDNKCSISQLCQAQLHTIGFKANSIWSFLALSMDLGKLNLKFMTAYFPPGMESPFPLNALTQDVYFIFSASP